MPRLSDLVPAPTPSRGTFVGREAELREFRNSVRYLLGSESPPGNDPVYPHFFLVHGEGGMGKTALVDLDSAHCPTIAAFAQMLADTIGKQHPGFDVQYRAACQRRAELAPRRDELHAGWQRWQSLLESAGDPGAVVKALRRRLAHGETQKAAFGISTPAYIALDMQDARRDLDALTSFYDEHRRGPRDLDELLRRKLGSDAAFVADDARSLGHALGRDLYELAEAAPLLLLLDTYERADRHDDWLRETVLTEPNTQLLVVIAGREKIDGPYQRAFSGALSNWASYYDLNQRRFQTPEVRDYLRKRLALADDPPDEVVEQVLAISRGIPLAVQALGDQLTRGDLASYSDLAEQPLDQGSVIAAMTERFLLYLQERPGDAPGVAAQKRNDRQRIRALALLRPGQPPDEQLAGCLWGVPHDQTHVAFHEMASRHSFVFRAGLFQMHELVHSFVRADMLAERRRAADWPLFEAGLRRALALVDERLARAERRTANPDERYDDAEWRDGLLDKLNLLLWLDQDADARPLLLNRWVEARYNAPALAVDLHALAAELAPGTSGWQRLVAALRDDEYAALAAHTEELEQHALAVLYYLRARQLQKSEDFTSALTFYNQSLELRPSDSSTLHDRAWLKDYMGDLIGAVEDYNQSLLLNTNDPRTLHNRGWVKSKLGDWAGAVNDYDRSLELRPDYSITLNNRGRAKAQLGDLYGALTDIDHSLDIQPDHPDTLHSRGWVKGKLADFTSALADYNYSLELRPNNFYTLHNRGWIKLKLKDLSGALADFNDALALRPDDAEILASRSCVKREEGDFVGALKELNRALKVDDSCTRALFLRGILKKRMNDLVGAVADFDTYLKIQTDTKTLEWRGYVKGLMMNMEEAIADLEKALRLSPKDSSAIYSMACIYAMNGLIELAISALERAIKMKPQNRERASADPDFVAIRGDARFVALVGQDDEGRTTNDEGS